MISRCAMSLTCYTYSHRRGPNKRANHFSTFLKSGGPKNADGTQSSNPQRKSSKLSAPGLCKAMSVPLTAASNPPATTMNLRARRMGSESFSMSSLGCQTDRGLALLSLFLSSSGRSVLRAFLIFISSLLWIHHTTVQRYLVSVLRPQKTRCRFVAGVVKQQPSKCGSGAGHLVYALSELKSESNFSWVIFTTFNGRHGVRCAGWFGGLPTPKHSERPRDHD